MKLLRLKLYDSYRSLQFDEQTFPKLDLITNETDPICLVGLNGSGKSNLLELIADIFYLVESDLLEYKVKRPYTPYSDNRKKQIISFEIDYKIRVKAENFFVRITRNPKAKKSEVYLFKDEKFLDVLKNLPYDVTFLEYVPLIVAYTSGLNDLLSMPFIELQDYYAREVTHQVVVSKNFAAEITEPSLMLMDFDSNAAILVSNYLLNGSEKLKIFERFARIEGLNSFKIVIQLNKAYGNKKVILPNAFEQIIEDLKKCATIYNHRKNERKGDCYEMDFLVNDVTRELFRHYFKTPKALFYALSKLNLLNALCVQKDYRDELRRKRKEGKLLKFPTIATLDKIFRIEQIELTLTKPRVRTEYMKISDGEHQFMHIVGGLLLFDENVPQREVLYLLDEPDTHFNPQWRSEFFSEIDKVIENKSFEIILTTHSPFILGDCHGYNVFVFERNIETNIVSFKRSSYETFGANFAFLLKNIFHFNHQMSDKSREHLTQLDTNIQNAEAQLKKMSTEELEQFEKELKLYGESVEKLFVLNRLDKLKDKTGS